MKLVRAVAAVLIVWLASTLPAAAWMPYTHVYLAEEALRSPLASGTVTIHQVDAVNGTIGAPIGTYHVDPDLLAAIRQCRGEYHAGLIGPDGFPDMAAGQIGIHADWEKDNRGGSTGDDWLTHLWRGSRGPAGTNLAAKAFTVGFLQHAAGDIMAHDFINYYTGGEWEFDHHNAIKHECIESLVSKYTPASSDPNFFAFSIDHVRDFIEEQMIHTPLLAGEGCRYSVLGWLEALKSSPLPLPPATARRVEQGLQRWPTISADLAWALMFNPSRTVDYKAADTALLAYLANFSSMIPDDQTVALYEKFRSWIPAGVQGNLKWFLKFRKMHQGLLKALLQRMEQQLPDMQYLEQALVDPETVWDRIVAVKDADASYPDHPITLEDFRRQVLHLPPGQTTYDYRQFRAAYNTYVISELTLLGPAEIRRLVNDLHKLTGQPPYDGRIPENIMLGFIRSLDGSHEWRPDGDHSGYPQMVLDPRSFRQIFMDTHPTP